VDGVRARGSVGLDGVAGMSGQESEVEETLGEVGGDMEASPTRSVASRPIGIVGRPLRHLDMLSVGVESTEACVSIRERCERMASWPSRIADWFLGLVVLGPRYIIIFRTLTSR
jgi:hypothetical protein